MVFRRNRNKILAIAAVLASSLAISSCTYSEATSSSSTRSAFPQMTVWAANVCVVNESGDTLSFNFVKGSFSKNPVAETRAPYADQVSQGKLARHETVCNTGRDFEITVQLPELPSAGTLKLSGGNRHATFNDVNTPWLGSGYSYYLENAGYRVDIVGPETTIYENEREVATSFKLIVY